MLLALFDFRLMTIPADVSHKCCPDSRFHSVRCPQHKRNGRDAQTQKAIVEGNVEETRDSQCGCTKISRWIQPLFLPFVGSPSGSLRNRNRVFSERTGVGCFPFNRSRVRAIRKHSSAMRFTRSGCRAARFSVSVRFAPNCIVPIGRVWRKRVSTALVGVRGRCRSENKNLGKQPARVDLSAMPFFAV